MRRRGALTQRRDGRVGEAGGRRLRQDCEADEGILRDVEKTGRVVGRTCVVKLSTASVRPWVKVDVKLESNPGSPLAPPGFEH
jgi:hypothetical protein